MKKDDIKKILKFEGADKDIEVAVNRVLDTLKAIPADADLGAMTSVENFNESGFGSFQYPDTHHDNKIDKGKEKTRILSYLESILIEVTTWIKDHPLQVKFNIISAKQNKDRARRKWLIAVLVIVAAVAIVLTIIQNVTSLIPKGVPIGEIVGLIDLLIGIGGFIYELADDSRKEAACNAVQEISKCKTDNELTDKAKNLVKVVKKIENSKVKVIGWFNHVEYHEN